MTIREFKENVVNKFAEKKYVSEIIPEELRHCIYDVVNELIEEGYQKVSVDWDRFYIRSF